MKLEIDNETQYVVLKSLLIDEIEYLENEAIPAAIFEDRINLARELEACKVLLAQFKN